jgi:hypothetical protein
MKACSYARSSVWTLSQSAFARLMPTSWTWANTFRPSMGVRDIRSNLYGMLTLFIRVDSRPFAVEKSPA